MSLAILLAGAIATALAWFVFSRRRDHLPVAVLLSVGLLSELGLRALEARVLAPLRGELGDRWHGWARAAGHLSDAVWLSGFAALAGAALVVFAGRRAWPAVAAWAGFVAAMVVAHPIASDGTQAKWLGAGQGLAVGAAACLFLVWRHRRSTPATPAQIVLSVVVTNELVAALSGWWARPVGAWAITHLLTFVVLGAAILIQGRYLWSTQPSPSPSA
jgi:hypothetical protein